MGAQELEEVVFSKGRDGGFSQLFLEEIGEL